jgi:hypothetical protein
MLVKDAGKMVIMGNYVKNILTHYLALSHKGLGHKKRKENRYLRATLRSTPIEWREEIRFDLGIRQEFKMDQIS